MHCHDLFFSIVSEDTQKNSEVFFKKHSKFLEVTKYIVRCTTTQASTI